MSFNRILIFLCIFFSVPSFSMAQWEEHYSYNGCFYGGSCSDGLFVGSAAAFFKYNTDDLSISKYSNVNCLSSVDISTVCYNKGSFVVGYSDGSIDYVNDETLSTRSLYDLKNADNVTSKSINAFFFHGNRLYCAFSSGLLEINLAKFEIKGFYRIAPESLSVYDVAVFNDEIYVATSRGVYRADVSNPILEDTKQWTLLGNAVTNFCQILEANGSLYVVKGSMGANCSLYKVESDDTLSLIRSVNLFRWIASSGSKVAIASTSTVYITDADNLADNISSFSKFNIAENGDLVSATPNIRSIAFAGNNSIVCADASLGMVISDFDGNAEVHLPNGPANKYAFDILSSNGVLYVSYGGLTGAYNNRNFPAGVHILNEGLWSSYTTTGRDLLRLCADPNRKDSVYVSSWGCGVYKLEKDGFSDRYNEHNSSLEDIFYPDKWYVRCGAICFDDKSNMYVSNAEVATGLKVRLSDGSWTEGLSYIPTDKQHSTRRMIHTSNGNFWLIIPRTEYKGLMVFNTNGTPENQSDDVYRSTGAVSNPDNYFLGQLPLVDQDGESLPSDYYAVVEDKDGIIWLGTNDGIFRCSQNDIILKNVARSQSFEHVKVPRNDGTNLADYLLAGVVVNDIIVDSENRKWVGTDANGLYLISADGMQTLKHFDSDNSPLPGNQIYALSLDESTGKLYIATGDKGVIAYQTDSNPQSQDDDEINLSIYPNPVLPSFVGDVSIEGLPADADVRISDVQGRLVYNAKASDGKVFWNLARFGYGPRVATGVYIVWVQTLEGKQKAVGKIAVVK